MAKMLYALLNIDVKALIAVLFWGNLTAVILIFSYQAAAPTARASKLSRIYLAAKLCQAGAFCLIFFRGNAPDFLTVNAGNTLLLIGFYLEAIAMFTVIQEKSHFLHRLLTVLLLLSVFFFNALEWISPDSSVRVTIASVCVFTLLVIPNVKLLFLRNATRFKRVFGTFYLCFLSLLLPRAIYAMFYQINIFTNSVIQSLTFLALVMLMFFSLSAYMLLEKENADKIISTLATTDGLTGLANRHGFLQAAAVAFERHKACGHSVAVLFLDIDFFKKINDTYGHSFGDDVLVRFGEIIRTSLRTRDLSCRYGGEEFVVLLAGAGTVSAAKISQRIMDEIARTTFEQFPQFTFTICIGVMSGVPSGCDTLVGYIEKADQAMYIAKETGRNKIVDYQTSSDRLV